MRYVSVILRRYRGDIGDGFTFIDVKKLGAPYDSTGFYFNDDVDIEVERIKQGLRIKRFKTKILDKQEKRLKGLDGLAMLLIDVDYDGEIFDMDRTVFTKDIGEDGKIRMSGLKESIAIIAIDKHGNESKTFIIKDE